MTDFDQFVATHVDDLLRTAYLIVWDEAEAEDLVQECLLKVARRWPRIRRMEQPRAYARRILVNLALDGARGRARRRRELEPGAVASLIAVDPLPALDTRAELLQALGQLHGAPTCCARPALLQRLDRGAGRRGSRLFAGDGQEQRLSRTRAAARGAAASSTPTKEHRNMSDLLEDDLREALADRAARITPEASARLRAVDYHPRSRWLASRRRRWGLSG